MLHLFLVQVDYKRLSVTTSAGRVRLVVNVSYMDRFARTKARHDRADKGVAYRCLPLPSFGRKLLCPVGEKLGLATTRLLRLGNPQFHLLSQS